MRIKRLTVAAVLFTALGCSWPAIAGTLANSPLSLKGSVPPNILFALSVEYPTAITAAYRTPTTYSETTEFLGLFDANKCYTYDTTNGWFEPASIAKTRTCTGQWSGNFMNWVSMTGLDEFRYAMTGGNRYVDTPTLTVLERSFIDVNSDTSQYFPNKKFSGTGATPYGLAITVANDKMGIAMRVTDGGTDSLLCSNPIFSSNNFTCSLNVKSTNKPVICTAWSGNGESASTPYICTSFGAGFPAGATAIPDNAVYFTAATSPDTVTCTNPSFSGGAFSCSLSLSGGNSGSCSQWNGTGNSTNPFYCASFGSFGEINFVAASKASAASFSGMAQTMIDTRVPASGNIAYNCTIIDPSRNSRSISCPIGNGYTAQSTTTSGTPRIFSSFISVLSDATILNATADTSGPTVSCGTRTCYTRYNIAYKYPKITNTPTTYYYIPSYDGNVGQGRYYIETYMLNLAAYTDYNVRVKVCDPAVSLESNCKAFGSSYKPTGVMQDEGDKIRFGIFSYYNSNDIDNAVMRSKLKYLAPQKYESSGGTVANANKEWSESNGVLVSDPDPIERTNSYPLGSKPVRSGAINYINQFGRPVTLPNTLPTTLSSYKKYDPVGKLYYESLKYLRGGQATSDFYQNASATTNDNFPVISNWDDPIVFSCQKNYIILLADKNAHCDKRLPGGSITSANVGPTQCTTRPEVDDFGGFTETAVDPTVNVSTWTSTVGKLEGGIFDARSLTGASNSASWYLAGLAFWAALNDIRTDDATRPNTLGMQRVKTYVIDVEEGGALSNAKQLGFAAKYGGADTFDLASGTPLNSTTPVTINGTAYNWPKTLLRASDPVKMITAVRSAISEATAQVGTESALAQSSGDLETGGGAFIYRATFNSGAWIGDVNAFRIDGNGMISQNSIWKASEKLPTPDLRRILSYNDGLQPGGSTESTSLARQGVVFSANSTIEFNVNFSSRQRDFLNRDAAGVDDGAGIQRVNYLRGDTSNENAGLMFRGRAALLGDIVNSNPIYVGPPSAGQLGNGYNAFAAQIKNRKPMVYVGGNDGMLHGYDASANADGSVTSSSGAELLAYVPSSVYSRLNKLTSPNYSHLYYVDGSPVDGDACFANCGTGTAVWKTMLVGGLNAGGQGVYALDITNPENFGSDAPSKIVLWEFTDFDDEHLGYTFGKPIIRTMNNGKWAVIFGNGFNNTFADLHASKTGRAYLYILYVTGPTGAGRHWQLGTDYLRYELPSPSEASDPTLPLSPENGLASVSGVDHNVDGKVDYLYAGDRYGNVWKFDVTSSDSGQWKSAFDDGTATQKPLPMFSATDNAIPPVSQQITTSIEVARHPERGFMVLFGTGSYIDTHDALGPFQTNSHYGLWDKNDATSKRISSRSELQKQKVLANLIEDGTTYFFMSNCKPNYSDVVLAPGNVADPLCPADIRTNIVQSGWVFDLPGTGERVVAEKPLLQGSILTFTTLTPAIDPCTGNTVGREYDISYLTGGASKAPIFDLNGDGIINTGDYRTVTINTGVTTTSVQMSPSGRQLIGGASDTPIRFTRSKRPYDIAAPSVCIDFIPRWGCLSKIGPPQTCKIWVEDVVSQEFLSALGGSGLSAAPMKCLNQPAGRVSWRQIFQ